MTQLAGNPRDVKGLLFSRNARRFKRSHVDASGVAGGSRAHPAMRTSDVVLR
jgi:hypothetical protein